MVGVNTSYGIIEIAPNNQDIYQWDFKLNPVNQDIIFGITNAIKPNKYFMTTQMLNDNVIAYAFCGDGSKYCKHK